MQKKKLIICGEKKKEMHLNAAVDVFHGDELFGLFVPHKPGHPEIPRSYILDKFILFHFYLFLLGCIQTSIELYTSKAAAKG